MSDYGLSCEAWSDMDLAEYKHMGLSRNSVAQLVFKKAASPAINIIRHLFYGVCCRCRWPGANGGDFMQIGGAFVFPPASAHGDAMQVPSPLYSLRQEAPGHPAIDKGALLEAARAAFSMDAAVGTGPAAVAAPLISPASGVRSAARRRPKSVRRRTLR